MVCNFKRRTPGQNPWITTLSAPAGSLDRTVTTLKVTEDFQILTRAIDSSSAGSTTCRSAVIVLLDGWQLATIVQSQSGSPINIVTSNSTVNGIGNTLRPDVTGPITIIGSVETWFDTSVFTAVPRFGNLGRNVVIGPGFNNTDFAIIKNTQVGETVRVQFRVEFFDLFNHANFGAPGTVVGTPAFGQITSTRFPTGESGSSRQIQFGMKITL